MSDVSFDSQKHDQTRHDAEQGGEHLGNAAKAAEAESVSSANPSFFIVLCSVRAIKGRYDTATAAVLWENVMFFYGFVK